MDRLSSLVLRHRSSYLRRLPWLRGVASRPQEQRSVASIDKLLVANRGEIACRIIRTARRMGIRTVAVYSDPDRHALHVAMADEAYHVGGAAAQDSYLQQERLLKVALRSGASAVHPGYGFLSENAGFAEACASAGVEFVGPPPAAIRDMGVKSTSKTIMAAAGVPVIGGYHGDDQSDARLLAEAETIGFPVMIKAVMGGGGKGMRIAISRDEFLSQLQSARREASKSFGDEVMLVEKYVVRPRHVEVQVFGDRHGNYVYLYERDCSVQRRHQKIIEEAPAPGLDSAVRCRLGEAAVRAARAVGYVGAGTVEFILDADHQFFFMEMNTRLQVEHPVSEMITDTDLVEWQLRVARGERLPLTQEHIPLKGHAFEARIYAEDPRCDFLPGAGPLIHLSTPQSSVDVRVETGVRQGDEVSVHYDPMIAKLVVWAEDRPTALLKLRKSLSEYAIVGVNTNIGFLMDLAAHPEFVAGNVDTDFIPRHRDQLFPPQTVSDTELCQVALAVSLHERREAMRRAAASFDPHSPFASETSARFNHRLHRQMSLASPDGSTGGTVDVHSPVGSGQFLMQIGDNEYRTSGSLTDLENGTSGGLMTLTSEVNGHVTHTRLVIQDESVHLFTENGLRTLCQPAPAHRVLLGGGATAAAAGIDGASSARAPMPGVVEKVLVGDGDSVQSGDPLVVIIAMKMEYVIKAPTAGVVEKVMYKVGDHVSKDSVLIKFQSPPTEDSGDQ